MQPARERDKLEVLFLSPGGRELVGLGEKVGLHWSWLCSAAMVGEGKCSLKLRACTIALAKALRLGGFWEKIFNAFRLGKC